MNELTPDQVLWARKLVREERQRGTGDADIEGALKDALGTSIAEVTKPRASDFWRGLASSITLQHADELAGLVGKARGGDYEATRDNVREQQHEFEAAGHRGLSMVMDLAGGTLPAMLIPGGSAGKATLAEMMGGAAALGGVEGEGRSEASSTSGVLKDAGISALTSGLAGGAMHLAGAGIRKAATKLLDGIDPSRPVVKEAALQIPKNADATIARQEALAPGTALIASLTPELRALTRGVGADPKAGLAARDATETSLDALKAARKALGPRYDALNQSLPVDDELRNILSLTKAKQVKGDVIDFKALQKIRTKLLETGRASRLPSVKAENGALADRLTEWMAPHVPDLKGVDNDYAFLTNRIKAATDLAKGAIESSKTYSANRVYGAEGASIGGSLPADASMSKMAIGLFKPSRAARSRAVQELLLTPGDATTQAMDRIAKARAKMGATTAGGDAANKALFHLLSPYLGSQLPGLLGR